MLISEELVSMEVAIDSDRVQYMKNISEELVSMEAQSQRPRISHTHTRISEELVSMEGN